MAIDYELKMNATLLLANEEINIDEIPLVIRIKNYDNKYFLDNENEWISIGEINHFIENDTLGINNYAYYTFEWKWDFAKDDDLDTKIGIIANDKDIKLIVTITTSAWLSDNPNANGGISQIGTDTIPVFNEITEVGGTIKILPFIILIIIIILLSLLTMIYIKSNKGNKHQEEKHDT